jgi:hypothetical protein
MSLSAVMMAARQPPVTAIAMKMILKATTKRLAALLAHLRGMRAKLPRPGQLEHRRRRQVALPADPLRIPAYLRRRRLHLRLKSRLDTQAVKLGASGHQS